MDTILNLFAPWILVALGAIAAFFGVKSKINERKASKAVAESLIYRQRAESMDASTKAQEAAQKAARGVPKPPPANSKNRGGLRGQR